ncbi:unnamed protein product [Mytilus edulis]|uniref:Death domain-containing protein n=1 Tax=Mytilus edulis TaxID=6550 RepID=A0A8S3TQI8_MYTED|nr:unnamed protein product [Mytilus edulis]
MISLYYDNVCSEDIKVITNLREHVKIVMSEKDHDEQDAVGLLEVVFSFDEKDSELGNRENCTTTCTKEARITISNVLKTAAHKRILNINSSEEHVLIQHSLSDDALSQIPSDIELLRFSTNCVSNQMHELVSYLEMSRKWDSITHNYPNDIEVAKYLVLSKWKEIKDQSNFKALAEALTKMDISTHFLCQVSLYYLKHDDIFLKA